MIWSFAQRVKDLGGCATSCLTAPTAAAEYPAIFVPTTAPSSSPRTAYIEPDSLWENGYSEGFNARDELLNGEIFYTLREAPDHHRKLVTPLQHCAATRLTPI